VVVVEVDEVVVVEDVVVVSGGRVVVDSIDVVVVGVLCQARAGSGKKLYRIAGNGMSQRL